MKVFRRLWRARWQQLVLPALAAAGLACLLWYHLGSLTTGLSAGEAKVAIEPVGWHGIFREPLDLPLKLVRSVVFWLAPDHGDLLTRLPNTVFGALAVACFWWLVKQWHGPRLAWLATLLFACGAWTLHASRLASSDVLYLWAGPALLAAQLALQQHGRKAIVWYGTLLLAGAMLYVPGLVWLLLAGAWLQRDVLRQAARHFGLWWQSGLSLLAVGIWLPLLAVDLARPGELGRWLGLPADWQSPLHYLKELGAVFVHLFVRGPQYPDIWLAKTPLLDVFVLATAAVGVYFYFSRRSSRRSRLLGLFFAIGAVLIALGGPVGLSLLVPLLYLAAATGLAYLLRDWLKVFPLNPLARGLGMGLIALAVAVSCLYSLRAYFVAWPHHEATKATFIYRRP